MTNPAPTRAAASRKDTVFVHTLLMRNGFKNVRTIVEMPRSIAEQGGWKIAYGATRSGPEFH